MIDAGMSNPLRGMLPRWESRLLQQRAQLRLEQQRPMDAFDDLMAAAAAVPTFDAVLAGAALLGSKGQAELGLRFLDAAPRPNPQAIGGLQPVERLRLKWLSHTRYYQHEFDEMRRNLLEDIVPRTPAAAR